MNSKTSEDKYNIASRSKLNPAAPVFVPQNSHYTSISLNDGSMYCRESQNDNKEKSMCLQSNTYVDDDYLLLVLKDFVHSVSSEPALYEEKLSNITHLLTYVEKDEELIMFHVANFIIDQAITDANFRYNGVRLCVYLEEKTSEKKKKAFSEELIKRCQREHNRREMLAIYHDGGMYLRGVGLFIADLSTRHPDNILIEILEDIVYTLLDHPTSENIKCACLILKLCGSSFEKADPSKTARLVSKLESFSSQPTIPPHIKTLIHNLITFKKNHWKTSTEQIAPNQYNPYADNTEIEGLSENVNTQNIVSIQYPYEIEGLSPENEADEWNYPRYDFGPCGDGGNKDVCDAFEEFLRSSGQIP